MLTRSNKKLFAYWPIVIGSCLLFLLAFVLIVLPKQATAQKDDGSKPSSAPQPQETTPEQLSPPDQQPGDSPQTNDGASWPSSAPQPEGTTPEQLNQPDPQPGDSPQTSGIESGGGTAYLQIAGSTLRPRSDNVSYTAAGGGGCIYATSGSTSTVWNTPLTLPDGATIDFLRMYFHDTSGSDTYGWFTIYDTYGSLVNEWFISSSGSSGDGFADSDPINHVVDYSTYSYVLNWRPNGTGPTLQLCGFQLFYQPPTAANFLPAVLNEAGTP